MFYLDELEDALRLEAEPEDIKTSDEGVALVKWLKKCRRILQRIQRLKKKTGGISDE